MKSQKFYGLCINISVGLLTVICILVSGCGGTDEWNPSTDPAATTAATVMASSAWDACEYDNNATAYGSITNNDPESTSQLNACGNYLDIVANGYVTTDPTGQAKMKNNGCTLYVFQEGEANVLSDVTVELSPEGQAVLQETDDCSKLTVVSLDDTEVTFSGTTATIIADHNNGILLVIVSDGTANVKPGDGSTPFDIPAGYAAYLATSDFIEKAIDIFGFQSGTPVEIEMVTPFIEMMGFAPQIRRANLTLLRNDLKIIPIQEPFQTGFRWLSDKFDDRLISQAITLLLDWESVPQSILFDGGIYFRTQNEFWDMKSIAYDKDTAIELLNQAGMISGKELIIVADESIPGVSEIAERLSANLSDSAGLAVTFLKTNPDLMNQDLYTLDMENIPILYLGGF